MDDVLVVGAGPTGLALATQVRAHGGSVRIVDRNADRAQESRALAIQPRTLEVLAGSGLAGTLVARGNPAVRLRLHGRRRAATLPLFDLGMADTDYPFLLFLSQAVTEQVLEEHLSAQGVTVEREVTLVDCADDGDRVSCVLRHRDGSTERTSARYLAGCDGAQSTVRELAGIRFTGAAYPQHFALADLEVDGLARDQVHAYFGGEGPLLFFPLGHPATWRMIAMRPDAAGESTLELLQALVNGVTGERLLLHDPAWLTDFRLHHRQAGNYRAGRLFVAGDAAHVHSPAGGQGMNVGIQDSWNLGWKLALVARGIGDPALLDSYHAERAPVGRAVVRFTDRAFRVATSTNPLTRFVRGRLVPRLAPLARYAGRVRVAAFRTLAELTFEYRDSPAVQDGQPAPAGGARAGDRLPGGTVTVDGTPRSVHEALGGPGFRLLLCGPEGQFPSGEVGEIERRYAGLVSVHRLAAAPDRRGWRRADRPCHYLVRPDGYLGYRAAGVDLAGLRRYLDRWLPGAGPGS